MEIVKVSTDQLGELAHLEKMYMEHHVGIDSYFSFEEDMTKQWVKYMENFLGDDNNLALAAVEDHDIIGYMTGSITQRTSIYRIKRVGLIRDAFVLPQHRRKRAFTRLVDEMLKWMKERGVQYVEHPVSSRNDVARTAWSRRGFEDFMVWMRKKI